MIPSTAGVLRLGLDDEEDVLVLILQTSAEKSAPIGIAWHYLFVASLCLEVPYGMCVLVRLHAVPKVLVGSTFWRDRHDDIM
jgi:hypothetical protein